MGNLCYFQPVIMDYLDMINGWDVDEVLCWLASSLCLPLVSHRPVVGVGVWFSFGIQFLACQIYLESFVLIG